MNAVNKKTNKEKESLELNKELEGNDKYPGEEQGKGEQVTQEDLKGKSVDGDVSKKSDHPIDTQKD